MIVDYNMNTAYIWATQLSPQPVSSLPECLQKIDERAKFLDELDKLIGKNIQESQTLDGNSNGQFSNFTSTRKSNLFGMIANIARKWFQSDVNDDAIISTCLRLWSGCLSAAKLIALSTRSGVNSPQSRTSGFTNLDAISSNDMIFAHGIEASPDFKRLRNEDFNLDGVPAMSIVRRYA